MPAMFTAGLMTVLCLVICEAYLVYQLCCRCRKHTAHAAHAARLPLLQDKEIERLNSVYIKIIKNAGVELVGEWQGAGAGRDACVRGGGRPRVCAWHGALEVQGPGRCVPGCGMHVEALQLLQQLLEIPAPGQNQCSPAPRCMA
jgi:hypothetical protein